MQHKTLPRGPFRWILRATIAAVLVLAMLGPTPANAYIPGSSVPGQGASNYVIWTRCEDVLKMTDADLTTWHDRGVDGFVCDITFVKGMGGTQDFTADPANPLTGANYTLQKKIRDTRIVSRAAAKGIVLYLGVYLENYNNFQTPLMPWFDDAKWSSVALPRFRDLSGAAKMMGFAGLAFDEELYAQAGGRKTATWKAQFPGNTHTVAEVRAKAMQRGRELMSAILSAYPNVQILDYGAKFRETWYEYTIFINSGTVNAYTAYLHGDFWQGMLSSEGYGEIDFLDAAFYKATLGVGYRWDVALTYEMNRFYDMWSRRLPNYAYASQHIGRVPYSWIDTGPGTYGKANSPAIVAKQLEAFERWSTGSIMADYSFGALGDFNYGPYVPGIQAASTPSIVDTAPPTTTLTSALTAGKVVATAAGATVTGTSKDDYAVQLVTWENTTTGESGFAPMTWRQIAKYTNTANFVWTIDWSFTVANPAAGDNLVRITTTDIHGLKTTTNVTVKG